jgi:ABC-type cobalamin/Fe3+-siderophores transport system ATPase subunit
MVVKYFVMNQIDTMDDKDNVTLVTCSMEHGQRLHLCDSVIYLVTNQVYMLSQQTLAIL